MLKPGFLLSLTLLAALSPCSRRSAASGPVVSNELTFRVDTVLSDINVPWGLAFLPNGDLLFTDRDGELRLVQDGKLHPDPIGGMPAVLAKGQGGLLDIALHPQYAENGWIYFTYSAPAAPGEAGSGANTALMRARIANHHLTDDSLLFKASPNYGAAHHYGGRIAFDRQGYLYLSIGDRGGQEEAQSLMTYRGKVLRFHDDGRIPADNPYAGRPDARPEIFSYGHRNPQGMALHPASGEIWTHEHGPKGGDEVNIVRAGHNYGWPLITFGVNYDGSIITQDTARPGMDQPVTYWVPSIAPCGMDFVTSERYGDWQGDLLVGSLKFRQLWRCAVEGDRITAREVVLDQIGRVRAVKQGPDGYLYIATEGPGMILRLIPR